MNAQNHRLGEQPQNLADIRRILPELLHIELPAANTARAYWAQHALPVQHADLISWLGRGVAGRFPAEAVATANRSVRRALWLPSCSRSRTR